MSSEYQNTITNLLNELKAGNKKAMTGIWDAYFDRLLAVSRNAMAGKKRDVIYDEGEPARSVVVSVFDRLQKLADQQKLPNNRSHLLYLLIAITSCKVAEHARRAMAEKRGSGRSNLILDDEMLAAIVSREPTPEFVAILNDEMDHHLELLGDPMLKDVALLDLEGYSVKEIAEKINRSPKTAERRLSLIRKEWNKLLQSLI